MAFTRSDIKLQRQLLASYQEMVHKATERRDAADDDRRRALQAVRSTVEILRAAGEDI